MFEAIISAISGITQGVGNIIASGNQVDIENAKVAQIEEQIALEEKKGENMVLLQALKNKQTIALSALASAKSEQGAKNLKTGVIGVIIITTIVFVYKIISKPEVQPNYQPTYL
jgi:hypothetical protein